MKLLGGIGAGIGAFVSAPFVAQAQVPFFDSGWHIVPEVCRACPCGIGGVLQTIQNLMSLIISLGIVIFVLLIVWAGFLLILSPANPGGRAQARKMLTNAVIGFVILISSWLIVDFVMKVLYGGDFGPWNEIISGEQMCIEGGEQKPLFSGGIFTTPGQTIDVTSGDIQQRICAAATAYRGANTSAGPSNGVLACAWAVNNVLRNASVGTVDGDSVRTMEGVLRTGRGTRVAQNAAVCGDLVLVTGQRNHVGICMNPGCSQVLSNSSSRKSFSWQSGPTFAPSYNDPNFRIYRIVR